MGFGNEENRRLPLIINGHGIFVAGGKGIPLGRVQHIGRRAGDGVQPLPAGRVRGGTQQRPGIGMAGIVENFLGGTVLHHLAGVHHRHIVGHLGNHTKIVGNEQHGKLPLLLQPIQKLQNLGLDGHIQGGGGFVTDQHLRVRRQGDGDDHPLAHTAGKLMGILVKTPHRVHNTHLLQQLQCLFPGMGSRQPLLEAHHLRDLLARAHQRVQTGQGVLEHHGDAPAPQGNQLPLRQLQQIPVSIEDAPGGDPGVGLQNAQNGPAGDGFTGPGLPHQRQGVAGFQGKGNIPHRLQNTPGGVKFHR